MRSETHSRLATNRGTRTILRVAGIFVVAAFLFANRIWLDAHRPSDGADGADLVGRSLPPALALTNIAFGPLRGLVATGLWWRIMEQQDHGNFFEVNQLSEWITILQPRNARVWAFQAWNLAFNVSAEFADPETRWKWILHGLELLTQRGIRGNPDSRIIREEIARIYFDRIGLDSDVHARYYQQQLALLIMKILPNGDRAELKLLASAPADRVQLLENQRVRQLVERLAAARVDLLNPSVFYAYPNWSEAQRKLIPSDAATDEALRLIDAYFRRRKLEDEFALDAERMLYIDREYGPFDWRLYHAYAVYWAVTGSLEEYALSEDAGAMARLAMQRSFMDGKLVLGPQTGMFVTTNNPLIIGRLHDYYDIRLEHRYTPEADEIHKRLLETASAILYTFNDIKAAREIYQHYYEDYEKDREKPDFEDFIARNLFKTLHGQNFQNQKNLIESALFQAYNWMATGDLQRAQGYANYARLVWARHQRQFAANPRKLLPPFDDLKLAAYRKLMESDVADAFKGRLWSSIDQRELDTTNGDPVYLGESIESGSGHRAFRERFSIENAPSTHDKGD